MINKAVFDHLSTLIGNDGEDSSNGDAGNDGDQDDGSNGDQQNDEDDC
ncbi:hypothetical protein [Haladaptatus sp. DFWS20]